MDKLPEELLCRIVKDVSKPDLLCLALVNRKLARITTPLLYNNCFLDNTNPNIRLRSTSRLLRTVLVNSQLSSLVQDMHIADWKTEYAARIRDNVAPISLMDLA